MINKTVSWGKALTLIVRGIGELRLKNPKTGKYYIIKGVYYIPELGINLLFISKLKGCYTLINGDTDILIYNKNTREIIIKGYYKNGLYYIFLKQKKISTDVMI